MLATVFHAVYDESSRVLTYANAGHEPAMLLRAADRDCLRLESRRLRPVVVRDGAARARRLGADVHRWNQGSAEYGR